MTSDEESYGKVIIIMEALENLCECEGESLTEQLFVSAALYATVCAYVGFSKEDAQEGFGRVFDWLSKYDQALKRENAITKIREGVKVQ
jgi:hypothetical protein